MTYYRCMQSNTVHYWWQDAGLEGFAPFSMQLQTMYERKRHLTLEGRNDCLEMIRKRAGFQKSLVKSQMSLCDLRKLNDFSLYLGSYLVMMNVSEFPFSHGVLWGQTATIVKRMWSLQNACPPPSSVSWDFKKTWFADLFITLTSCLSSFCKN